MSKVDKLSQVISDYDQDTIHFNKIFKSRKVLKLMANISSDLGVQRNLIYPIIHYSTSRANDIYNDTYILYILSEIQKRGKAYRINRERVISPNNDEHLGLQQQPESAMSNTD